MFCPNCGKELGDNYKFCFECGFKIDFSIPKDDSIKSEYEAKPENVTPINNSSGKSKLEIERERRMRAAQLKEEQTGKKKRGGIGREIRGKMRRAMLHWFLIFVGLVLVCFILRSIHYMRVYGLTVQEYGQVLSDNYLDYKIETRTNLDVVFKGYGKGFTVKGIYLSYTKAMADITPQLVEEFKAQASTGDKTIPQLKELFETTIMPLAEIADEAETKMDIMKSWSWTDYNTYSFYKKKLYEKYKEYALEVGREYVNVVGDASKKETADSIIANSTTVNPSVEKPIETEEKDDKSKENVKENTKETVVEKDTNEKDKTESIQETNNSNGVDPKLKAFMDSYEAYIDEYVKFMKSYDATDINSLSKYSKMLEKYTDFEKKVNAYDTKNMSQADLEYYTEVLNRCNKKLLDTMK